MDSREEFLEIIRKEYSDLTQGKVDEELLDAVSIAVTDHYYEQYIKFRRKYPKSVNRYSTFQRKDLNHPHTYELILKTIKKKIGSGYEAQATGLLAMSLDELKRFEKNREDFHNMF